MSFRHRPPSDSRVLDQGWEDQRPLAFGTGPRVRDEKTLLSALTGALSILVKRGDGTALQQSFGDAVRGLGAESGFVARLLEPDPPRLEVVCTHGLPPEYEAGCEPLQTPGVVSAVIRRTLEEGKPSLIENSQLLDAAAPHEGPASSIACVPVTDSLTGAPLAVLYVQNEVHRAFGPADLDWLVCYAVVLGQALPLQAPQPPRLQDPKPERPDAGIEIVGSSVATRRLIDTLDMFLPSTARPDAPPILVTGESGTGKELVARYVHHYSPKRGRGPFHACNCATLRGDLAETRLFGHLKGSFTSAVADAVGLFRAADKGVLFLDEIGEMPIDCQALLLRVIETRHVRPVGDTKEVPVDVQLVVATNRQLEKEVENGRFREDLWYRLNGLRVELAPLRDPSRISDVKTLLGYYLALHERAPEEEDARSHTPGLPGAPAVLVAGQRARAEQRLHDARHAHGARRVDRRREHRPLPPRGALGPEEPEPGGVSRR